MNHALIDSDEIVARAERRLGLELSGKWTLNSILGMGGMATVYAAQHRNQSRVAIKMLHAHFSTDPIIVERFLAEGYAGNSVEHRGVVRVLDDGTASDGAAFVVMDLLEGLSLEELLDRVGPLPPALGVDFGIQATDILLAAHEKGVVHRDIKPDNFFITFDGEVKLLDFGIARVSEKSRSTTVGTFMGTPAFASPEQARGLWKEVDWQSDLWSLAATMFTALTGEAVHAAETSMEQLAKAVQAEPRPIESVGAPLPDVLCAVINRALRVNKNERFSSLAVFLDRLLDIERQMSPPEHDLGQVCEGARRSKGQLARGQPSYARRSLGSKDMSTSSDLGEAPTRPPPSDDEELVDRMSSRPGSAKRRRGRGSRPGAERRGYSTEKVGTPPSNHGSNPGQEKGFSQNTSTLAAHGVGANAEPTSLRRRLVHVALGLLIVAGIAVVLTWAPVVSPPAEEAATSPEIEKDHSTVSEDRQAKATEEEEPAEGSGDLEAAKTSVAGEEEDRERVEASPETASPPVSPQRVEVQGSSSTQKASKAAAKASPPPVRTRPKTPMRPAPAPAPAPEKEESAPPSSSRELMLKGRY